jgi:2-succinyl-5-enolpyruvyl-6-hydroxy-3-cyclohexene-1-carboxylate synthase
MTSPPRDPADRPAPADVQATFAATLVDEWVRGGLAHAVVCPGSRSTPLALALVHHGGVRAHVHHDERSGGFLGLGIDLATRLPALVLTTSGTAAAELHPVVIEADLAEVPLLVCTADRPPELRDVGAPQTIDQVHLYGRAVRWYGDPGVPEAAASGRWRAFAARALTSTIGGHPGPVHLNLPFREPLVGRPLPLPPARGDGPWTEAVTAQPSAAAGAAASVPAGVVGRRGVIVAGAAEVDGPAVHAAAAALGWPVIVEPRSPAWAGPEEAEAARSVARVTHLDAILRSSRAAEALRPDVILRIGAPPASRVVNEWLAGSGAVEIVTGAPGWSDPAATAAVVVEGEAGALLAALGRTTASGDVIGGEPTNHVTGTGERPRLGWLDLWRAVGTAADEAVDAALAGLAAPNEPAVARDLVRALPDGARLVVSSSMPIRDVERYASPRAGLTVLANRGANGIDGVVSTAVGVALGAAAPTALLVGDVAFLHDSNGLLGVVQRDVDLVCVVVDNDGGGIFSFLPQARSLAGATFESLFGTPHGLDLVALAAAYGVEAHDVTGADLGEAVGGAAAKGGVHVLVVHTDRAANVEVHRAIDETVAAAVDTALDRVEARGAARGA